MVRWTFVGGDAVLLGAAAGDRAIIEKFVLYRTYHGSQMSNAVQLASIAAWKDEAHVVENRRLYRDLLDSRHRGRQHRNQ